MPIIDLYSKRKKRSEKSDQPEIYQYDEFPLVFRRRVIHIWCDAIGLYQTMDRYGGYDYYISQENYKLWSLIYNILNKELGLSDPISPLPTDPFKQCKNLLLDDSIPVDYLLDLIEITFNVIDKIIREELKNFDKPNISQPDEAISELNHRFREHEIGYQFEGGQIIRVDSKFIHAEVVVPALGLLSDPNFAGPEQEFRSAHEHYRRQEYKDAIVDALNSFESTIKSICDVRGWEYSKTATAQKLIEVIFTKELIPKYLQTHFSSLRSMLEAGVPTVRNKTSGHGQGATPVDVPEHLAAYVLHLTASNIVMLIEAHKAHP
jgi:AbiJ N-terminal domain 4